MQAEPFSDVDPVADLAASLAAIKEENTRIQAFLALADEDELRRKAEDAAARRRNGQPLSPIDGVTVGVKDNIDTADLITTYGSGLYAGRVPDVDAPVVARLRAAGALIVGKTNLTELACGTEGRNQHFGDVVNPAAPDRYPGGSSSGSAAAIAAGFVPLAVGSDTSCSIRNPAASCGIVGLKPTFGRVPIAGVSVCSTRIDHVGPMARSCAEAAVLLRVLQDPRWSDPISEMSAVTNDELTNLTVGVLGGPFTAECEAVVSTMFGRATDRLRSLGVELREVDLGLDLAEVDGQVNVLCREMLDHYGEDVSNAARGLVSPEVRRWFDHYRKQSVADYAAAVRFQDELRGRVDPSFAEVDVLICPTMRSLPELVTTTGGIPANRHLSARADRAENCSLWDLTGHPSLSIPGPVDRNGAPAGLLLNGRHGHDGGLLALGAVLQRLFAEADC